MNANEVMRELQTLGTEQNRKIYRRHGVGENMFGLSYANLGALKKKIKTDHALAEALWASGNHDARVLATMIADPAQMTDRDLEAWARDLDNYVIVDNFVGLAAKTAFVRKKADKWSKSKDEWIGRAGWHLIGQLAMHDPDLPDDDFEAHLAVIERDVHTRKNRVREAMNNTLIAIGIRNAALQKKAIAAAKRIGAVDVDHGETGCKTPDAVPYILKAAARKKGK